jgi:hypothetical protein
MISSVCPGKVNQASLVFVSGAQGSAELIIAILSKAWRIETLRKQFFSCYAECVGATELYTCWT